MAQATPTAGGAPTVVLVHGAFADASSWAGVIRELQADGLTVVAPANPLRSVSGDAAYVASVVNQVTGPVLLVGCVGGETLRRSCEAVRDGGRVAGIVDPSPPAAPRGIRSHYFAGAADAARLRALAVLVDAGQLTVRIGEVFSLDHVREAATRVEAGHGRGLTILAVDGTTGGR
jgi:NADPH:quinone reductase-like Zn-dependent oxidoreductase